MSILLRKSSPLWSSFRIINTNTKFAAIAIAQTSRCYCDPAKHAPRRNPNEPIPFVGSSAHSWTSKESRTGTIDYDEVPWFQTYVVCASVAIFLIYFCVLREENDVDLELEKSLYDRVPGLEQTQLVINYKYNIENNIDNSQIVERMKELGMNPAEIKI